MKNNIAYKVSQGSQDYPDGFVTESMETDEDVVDGYTVVSNEEFREIMLQNPVLMKKFLEEKSNIPKVPNEVRQGRPRIPPPQNQGS